MTIEDLLPVQVEIPAGRFLMGTPDTERSALAKRYGGTRESYAEESPQHEVDLPAFAIMQVPVTNRLFARWVSQAGIRPPVTWQGATLPSELANHPAVDVSWEDAVDFAHWLSQVTGAYWKLPTEAQWEKAARGDDGRQFPWGNAFDVTCCNSREAGRGGTTPVGAYPQGASPFGVLDMAGNIWEWTRSLQARYPYEDDGRNDLPLPARSGGLARRLLERLRRHRTGPVQDLRRVLRGGCYANPEGFARCACRFRLAPAARTPFLGFRLVCELASGSTELLHRSR